MRKLDALWAYQEAEQRKAQLETAIRSTPSRVQFNKLHKQLKAQQASIQKMGDELEAREQQMNKFLEQVKRLEDRLDLENSELETISGDDESTAEEMTELRGDVERLGREIASVAREAKSLLAEIERATETYQQTRTSAGRAKKEYDALRAVCEQERDASAEDFKACDEELARLAADVDPALMTRYQKVKLHHSVPISKVVNCKCGGCNMSLPMAVLKKLAAPDAVIECENCGRILYPDNI